MNTNGSTAFIERLGMIVGIALVLNMSFTTVAPFFIALPPTSVRLIDQQQTILQSVFMVLVGYLWGNSAGNKAKDNTIEAMAKTAQVAGAELAPKPDVVVPPGDSVTIKADDQSA